MQNVTCAVVSKIILTGMIIVLQNVANTFEEYFKQLDVKNKLKFKL